MMNPMFRWKKTNALNIISDLEVHEVPTMKWCRDCKTFTDLKFHHYNGYMTGYLPAYAENLDECVDDEEWWGQFDIEHRASLKAAKGGLDETAHPWSELRKYGLQGIEMLQKIIKEGKEAEELLAKVVPNIPDLNKMVKQEQQTEEAKLARMVK
jgi:hypothetical protein